MADNKEDKPEEKKDKKGKKKEKKEERKKLNTGHVVKTVKGCYTIESVLGSGGFGDVYAVVPSGKRGSDRKYAMKTEYFDEKKRKLLNRLKVEMAVFSDIEKCSSPIDKSHFVGFIDKGKTETFKFIIMEMVSYSLIDIRTNMMNNFTSTSTLIQIARQTLQSIEALHYIGYVHRDIKPHNFAIGRPPFDSKIYMLDFGIARKYLDNERRVRIPRKVVRFLGTVKYAARACHAEKEQCRRDDMEVWCYMILEYYSKENLRWRRQVDRKKILSLKTELMTNYKNFDPKLAAPKKFLKVIDLIESYTYTCTPDYAAFHKILDEVVKDENIDESQTLDWVGKKMDKDKKKKKANADEKLMNDEDTHDVQQWEARGKKRKAGIEKKKKLEDELANIYKELDENRTPEQIREEIRNRMKKGREERRRKREERRDDDDYEDDDESDDDYSEETEEPRRRSKMGSVMKSVKDDPSRHKYESRKMRTGKRNSRDDRDDDRDGPSRKKSSRKTKSSYGNGGSRMESLKRKSKSRMEKPPAEDPTLKSVSVKMTSVNDYIVFKTANDMEKDADAKEAADKKAKDKEKDDSRIEVTGKVTDHDRRTSSSRKKDK